MQQDFTDFGTPPTPYLPVDPFCEIKDPEPDDKSPTEVSETMSGRVKWKSGDIVGFDAVADETASGVGIEGYHEEEGLKGQPYCIELDDGSRGLERRRGRGGRS